MTERFTKTVDIKAVDEDDRTATGAVLVPDELDRQGDFLRAEAVERFYNEDVETGVMHSAFPEDAATLERSEVLGTSEELGGATYPPGTWVATRRYEDDDLWQLVKDGVLTGFSIGGEISDEEEHATVPEDVTVPEEVSEETASGPVAQLIDGTVDEVSDVDVPAVPRATYKGDDLGKSLLDQVDGEDEFVALMTEQRGHDEDDARRLYQYLTEHSKAAKSGATQPDAVEKPFAGFDDWDDCMQTMTEERGHNPEAAERICGSLKEEEEAAAPTGKVEINGTEIDLTLPDRIINAAQAVEDNREHIPDECGTGVGDRRVRQALGDGLGADVVREVAAYLDSHEEDLTAEGPPTDWSDEEWSDCGNAQYAKWLFYADWFRSKVNEIDRARDEDLTYPDVENMDKNLDNPAYDVGDKVSWEWQGATVHGRVADIGEQFTPEGASEPITGDEGEAVYLIHDWDEEAEAFDVEGTAKPQSSLSESTMDMPAVDEADTKAGLLDRVKAVLGLSTGSDDDGTSSEALDAEKTGVFKDLTPEQSDIVADAVEEFVDAHGAATVGEFRSWFWEMDWQEELDPDQIVALESAFDDWFDEMAADEQIVTEEFTDWLSTQTDADITMSKDDTEDPPAWAADLTEKVEQIEKRIDDVENNESDEKALEDAPEWATELAEKVDTLDERVDTIATQSGGSQQLGKSAEESDEQTEKSGFTLDPRKAGGR